MPTVNADSQHSAFSEQQWHFADAKTAAALPVPTLSSEDLERTPRGIALTLEARAGELLVPSFSSLAALPYRFRLDGVPLAPVPSTALDRVAFARRYRSADSELDAWTLRGARRTRRLELEVPAAALATAHWLGLSLRPRQQPATDQPPLSTHIQPTPPALSQMTWPNSLGPRICSPTATVMALRQQGYDPSWETFVHASRDSATGIYGVWPLALQRASELGALGAVLTFRSFESAALWLNAGYPMVTSIRYASGALPGAPQPQSGGHLVVLYGVDGSEVLVNDPAAKTHEAVPRRYPLTAFGRAWLNTRGAAYLFMPKTRAEDSY